MQKVRREGLPSLYCEACGDHLDHPNVGVGSAFCSFDANRYCLACSAELNGGVIPWAILASSKSGGRAAPADDMSPGQETAVRAWEDAPMALETC
jgi:hypothetical protein